MTAEVFEYIVKINCEKSFTLSFSGNASEATLFCRGNPLDRVEIFDVTEGELRFFNGVPLHGGLVKYNGFEVHFLSTCETAPSVTVHECEKSLTWSELRKPNKDDYYTEEVIMTQPYRREKNILIYSGYMGSGLALMRYSY
ncbi:Hypothetical protein PACV_393 [Pacmanvirus A23]|uniref:Hypothetical protein n=1 Tax=Pacmanvirus A23 TaxID=1932881 RepID=UPI000A096521|nr:Hypothetical protein B9W72_gp389 [Pacmanvirus A23]SIP86106.1 Hypothetical protein PACV_393 [Pacmanvirus A23]